MGKKVLCVIQRFGKAISRIIVDVLLTVVYALLIIPYRLLLAKPKSGWGKPYCLEKSDIFENMW